MKYRYEAYIIDEETEEAVASISVLSQESLEEEMGKSKWTKAIERHEDEQIPDEVDEEEMDLQFQTTRDNAVQDSGFMGQID